MDLVTLAEVKDAVRGGATSSGMDAHFTVLADAAEQWVARHCGVSLTAAQVTEYLGREAAVCDLQPFRLPLVSVSEIIDTWTGDTIEAADYQVRPPDQIVRQESGRAPVVWNRGNGRYKVTLTGGYKAAAQADPPEGSQFAPSGLKAAVLMLAQRVFEVRGGHLATTAENYTSTYDKLADGEIAALLAPFAMAPRI